MNWRHLPSQNTSIRPTLNLKRRYDCGAPGTPFKIEIGHKMTQNEDMETPTDRNEWDFFDYDGAIFRRPKGNTGGVTHVFNESERTWHPYGGADKTKPWLFGDSIGGPLQDYN